MVRETGIHCNGNGLHWSAGVMGCVCVGGGGIEKVWGHSGGGGQCGLEEARWGGGGLLFGGLGTLLNPPFHSDHFEWT